MNKDKRLCGVFTAAVTPFAKDGFVDHEAMEKFINWQINNGIDGLVICGSTGEAHTLSEKEYKEVVENSVSVIGKRVPAIIGTGTNNTASSIEMTKFAYSVGADFAMIVAPYYNKPHQEGIFEHFKKIASEVDIEIVAYNVPGRTSIDISDSTILKIAAEIDNVVGLKDATTNLNRVQNLRKLSGDRLVLLSGDDQTSLAFNLYGGDGAISVISNVVPRQYSDMQKASAEGDFVKAARINNSLFDLNTALNNAGTNPIPIKYAVSLVQKYMSANVRLPLTCLGETSKKVIKHVINED